MIAVTDGRPAQARRVIHWLWPSGHTSARRTDQLTSGAVAAAYSVSVIGPLISRS
jgi:hypothetical protein